MFKNVASQKITFLLIDTANNVPKAGDSANLTAYVSKDDGAVTVLGDTTATELDATNAPGLYSFDLTQAETNADKLVFSGKSSTANMRVVPVMLYTLPSGIGDLTIANNAMAANITRISGSAVSTSTAQLGVNAVNIGGTAQTGRDIGASVLLSSGTGTGQVTLTSGRVNADITHIATAAVSTSTAQLGVNVVNFGGNAGTFASGRPEVNTTHAAGTAVQASGGYFLTHDILVVTTIATLSSQTSFTLTAGSSDNNAYVGCEAYCLDQSTAVQKCVGVVSAYTGASKTVTLRTDPGVFTMATGDTIVIKANRSLQPTVDNRTLDVSTGGEAGLDWANVGSQSTSVNLSGTTTNLVNTVTTYTGNTPQTGDSYARIGANGASLSAIPWNASWDAEVQSECADALTAFGCSTVTTSQVNAEVVDALATDTYAESSGVVAATASLAAKIQWLATLARNKITQTATTQTLRNDADSGNVATSTHSDDGTTHTRGEWA